MKEFLKENIAIVAAIALPVLLVVLFMASTAFTAVTVEDPKYDFLIATDYYNNENNSIRFDVVQEKLVATYYYPAKEEQNRYNYNKKPKLWRVHVADMSISEISLPTPTNDGTDAPKTAILDIPDLKNARVVNRQPGPDGYSYEYSSRRYRGNIMTEIFSYDSYYTGAAIIKDGRTIPIKGQKENRYNYNSEFIAWIVGDQ